jgi:hypothetical protein
MSIIYRQYAGEKDLPAIMALVQNELSEPYVIYTYRYFLDQWSVRFIGVYRLNNDAEITFLGLICRFS